MKREDYERAITKAYNAMSALREAGWKLQRSRDRVLVPDGSKSAFEYTLRHRKWNVPGTIDMGCTLEQAERVFLAHASYCLNHLSRKGPAT